MVEGVRARMLRISTPEKLGTIYPNWAQPNEISLSEENENCLRVRKISNSREQCASDVRRPSPSPNTNIFLFIHYLCVRIFQWSLCWRRRRSMWMQCACAGCCLQTNKLCVFRIIYIVHEQFTWKISKRAVLAAAAAAAVAAFSAAACWCWCHKTGPWSLGLESLVNKKFTAYQWAATYELHYICIYVCILCLDDGKREAGRWKKKKI